MKAASLVTAIILASLSTPVWANEDDTPPPATISPEEAAHRDAAAYANASGISVEDARQRLAVMPALQRALDASAREAGSRFAGGWIDHDGPQLKLVARFTGDAQGLEKAMRLLDSLAVQVDVRLGADHSLADLTEGQARIRDTIYNEHPAMGMWVDVKTGTVTLVGTDDISAAELGSLSELARVPVVQGIRGEVRPDHTYGGHRVGSCTTAFSSYDAVYGTTGVLTAGHCAGGSGSQLDYYQGGGLPSYKATLGGKRYDANQDFAWYTTPHVEYPLFYDGSNYRDVLGTRSRATMVGNLVCKYGRVTSFSCGFVDTIHYDPGFN